ncbi:hypothetical protein [Methylobacillus glycogenes]|uniref:hypothetical protein n=1 Tax=Methylobacillus glycogenes TaxID=406 RepID=UPI000471705C|nr:hypothetical protein [Methylobacillus glycogenes]
MKKTTSLLAMILAATFTLQTQAAEELIKLDPKPGQWSTVIAIYDHNHNHYLLKTSVHDDIESCSARLQNTAEQIKKANNVVYTAPRNTKVSFVREEGIENESKVLEIRCVLEPSSQSVSKRFI